MVIEENLISSAGNSTKGNKQDPYWRMVSESSVGRTLEEEENANSNIKYITSDKAADVWNIFIENFKTQDPEKNFISFLERM